MLMVCIFSISLVVIECIPTSETDFESKDTKLDQSTSDENMERNTHGKQWLDSYDTLSTETENNPTAQRMLQLRASRQAQQQQQQQQQLAPLIVLRPGSNGALMREYYLPRSLFYAGKQTYLTICLFALVTTCQLLTLGLGVSFTEYQGKFLTISCSLSMPASIPLTCRLSAPLS